ncbi:MAG: hypothetical protein K2M85_04070 [Paramuribaculum sp.]|nr:hypothetical protein [Paramuribaculum sp.]
MDKKISVEYTQMRVNNSGDAGRKYYMSADVRTNDDGEITQISAGTIQILDGRTIGGFGAPEMDGFSLNINSGYTVNRAEVFAEVNGFIAAIREEGGEA